MPPLPADSIHARACKLKCEKILTRPKAAYQIATQRKRLRFGKKEQQNERALTFIKNRSKRYKACSDVEHHNTIDA